MYVNAWNNICEFNTLNYIEQWVNNNNDNRKKSRHSRKWVNELHKDVKNGLMKAAVWFTCAYKTQKSKPSGQTRISHKIHLASTMLKGERKLRKYGKPARRSQCQIHINTTIIWHFKVVRRYFIKLCNNKKFGLCENFFSTLIVSFTLS